MREIGRSLPASPSRPLTLSARGGGTSTTGGSVGLASPSSETASTTSDARRPNLQPRRAEPQHVAVSQLRRRERAAVAQERRARDGLDEDLAVREAEPRQWVRGAGGGDRRGGAAERDREVGRAEPPLALARQDAERGQSASSQRSATAGGGAPAFTVNCRRTSR